MKQFLNELQKKHLVESITISNLNGSALASSNGSGQKDALSGTALFNYINSEMPKSEIVLIKSHSWKMLIPWNEKIYIITAASDLAKCELESIAKEIEIFLQKNSKQKILN